MADTASQSAKPIFPGLTKLYDCFSGYSYALMRFGVGAVLVPHGVDKLFFGALGTTADVIANQTGLPSPTMWAFAAACVQLIAGACLALGFLTRPAALLVWLHMTVSVLIAHWSEGYFWTNGGIEYPLLSWLLCVAIFFNGGGRYSLDRMIGREV